MNKKEVQGTARAIKGKAGKSAGKVAGNDRIRIHGKVDAANGKAEKAVGRAQSKAHQIKDDAVDVTRHKSS
jgi:uncharacterized protein YjbJ (UPF0337 family)